MRSKIVTSVLVIIAIGIGYGTYIWFTPHRNIQTTNAFTTIDASALVNEFLSDKEQANSLYLDSDEGESKVLIVTGSVASIFKDQLGEQDILLKKETDTMGVSCTFTLKTNKQVENIQIGDVARIKGVIRSGAEYDADLDLIEHVIIEKSALVKE